MNATSEPADFAALARGVKDWGQELGFQKVGIAGVDLERDSELLDAGWRPGRHGGIGYMARHGSKRARPAELVRARCAS